MELGCSVNGRQVVRDLAPQELLLDFLRDSLGLTGAEAVVRRAGVRRMHRPRRRPARQLVLLPRRRRRTGKASRRSKVSPSGPSSSDSRRPSLGTRALQCGFCTPGMLLTVTALLEHGELGGEEEIKHNLAGNLCRCTGYRGILEAVAELAAA